MVKGILGYWGRGVPRKIQPLVFLAVGIWILFAFHSYLPTLSPMRTLNFWLDRTDAYDALLALWFAVIAYCVGRRFLRLIGVTAAVGAEEITFSIAAGAMLFSWGALILSLLHGLYMSVAYALLLVPTAICIRELKRIPGIVCRTLIRRIKSLSWSAGGIGIGFLGFYIFVVLGVVLISALAPSFEYDDLVYHLAGPKNFIMAHKLVPLPDVPLAFLPKNIEMLHTLGMLWHSDIVSKLLVFLCGCITMAGTYSFLARFVSRAAGMIAAAILASSPLFIWEMRTAHNDIGLTLFLFAGLYATVIWLRTRESPWFRLASFFLAFSLGAKYWAFLAVGIIVMLVFFTVLKQSRAIRQAFSAAFKLGLCSSLGLLPWSLVNLYSTGNPVFPLLNGVFQSPYWTSAHTSMIKGELFQGGIRIAFSNWWDLFRLPWEMMVDPLGRFGGNIGPWYVIFIPLLLFFSGMGLELGFLFAAGAFYYIGWAVYGPCARFLLPALPCLAAGAAFAIMHLLQVMDSYRRIIAVSGSILLCILAVPASPFFEANGSGSRYGNPLISASPLKHLSKNEYLRRFYRGYRAVEYLNQIPGDKKVLYVHSLADGFYLNGKAAFHYSPYVPGLDGESADRIHDILRQHGITHVVVDQPGQETSSLSSRESDFTRRYLRKLFQRNAGIVYELLPGPVDQTVVLYDFMNHLDETKAASIPPGTPGSAYKAVRAIRDDSRYTIVTTPPSGVEFLVSLPDQATFSFAAARENPACTGKGSLQVWISTSESERKLVYSRDLEGRADGWVENEVNLKKYGGRRVAITFQTEESSVCGNYFWADPVLIAPSTAIRSSEIQEEPGRELQAGPIVLTGKATPASVKIGQQFDMSFSGSALTPESYFDVRYLAPDTSVEQVVLNWQHGISFQHSMPPSVTPGKWLITGVRAHHDSSYHEGAFNPVKITLEVMR